MIRRILYKPIDKQQVNVVASILDFVSRQPNNNIMTTNTRLFHFNSNSTFKLILLVAGIGIAMLTFPSFGTNNQKESGIASIEEANLVVQTALVSQEAKQVVNYNNFLASYFLQEASIDRSNLKPADANSPMITLVKLPFSAAINVWTALKGQ